MSGIAIGLFIGAYLNSPALRRTVGAAVKKALGMGVDAINGKTTLIDPPQEAAEEE